MGDQTHNLGATSLYRIDALTPQLPSQGNSTPLRVKQWHDPAQKGHIRSAPKFLCQNRIMWPHLITQNMILPRKGRNRGIWKTVVITQPCGHEGVVWREVESSQSNV